MDFHILLLLLLLLLLPPNLALQSSSQSLTQCLRLSGISNYTSLQHNPSTFYQLLNFSIHNLRFTEITTPKPSLLIFPLSKKQVQKAFLCSLNNKWEMRIRSGGHSYEGLSSTASQPFVIIDLFNLDAIDVDVESKTAWVEAGATVGQLCYAVSQKASQYGFPTGSCPTVGNGGQISGGGYGLLSRKHGVSADHVIDAIIVNASGGLLDRQSMGEDLFWALRGGGGGSWGIVVAWKISLVPVPPRITVFSFTRTGREQVTDLVYKWQTIASSAPKELYIAIDVGGNTAKEVRARFYGQYLGPLNETLALVNAIFPDLEVVATDCREVTWIESVFVESGLPSSSSDDITALTNRSDGQKTYFKTKSDYVTTPIPKQALEALFVYLEQHSEILESFIEWIPYGGRMDEIRSDAIAFPHRQGNLYLINYSAQWNDTADDARFVTWVRSIYNQMTPYVSKNPRAAYVNTVDLDLGAEAAMDASWGESYFVKNFGRLVEIKRKVDPENVFRQPQSIPIYK